MEVPASAASRGIQASFSQAEEPVSAEDEHVLNSQLSTEQNTALIEEVCVR